MSNDRLTVVFNDLQQAVADVVIKHAVTPAEFEAAVNWVEESVQAKEFSLAALLLFSFPVQTATFGQAYANPEKDGATAWIMPGPAYAPGAPLLPNPAVLPMRPDEPGEPLVVSGTVRSTSGEPVAGALLDIWQATADGSYSDLTPEMVAPLTLPDWDLPEHLLRGKIRADEQGRYEYRTIVPGLERVTPPGSLISDLLGILDRAEERPLHIHAIVSSDGFHTLTHQVHFAGDPRIDRVTEGSIPADSVHQTGQDGEHRTLTCDYVLRPVVTAAA
jgi:catechol 1,2-dioxygenase